MVGPPITPASRDRGKRNQPRSSRGIHLGSTFCLLLPVPMATLPPVSPGPRGLLGQKRAGAHKKALEAHLGTTGATSTVSSQGPCMKPRGQPGVKRAVHLNYVLGVRSGRTWSQRVGGSFYLPLLLSSLGAACICLSPPLPPQPGIYFLLCMYLPTTRHPHIITPTLPGPSSPFPKEPMT